MSFQLIFDVLWTLKGRKRRKSISKFGDWWPMVGSLRVSKKKEKMLKFVFELITTREGVIV